MKVAKILTDKDEETFALVDPEGKLVATKVEIEKQTGFHLPNTVEDFLFKGYSDQVQARAGKLSFSHDIRKYRLLSPITRPFKTICLAFNYSDQSTWVRFGKDVPKEPVIYMKSRTCLVGPYDDIVCPRFVTQLDYEGELAFAIGKNCKNVSESEALGHVAGYFVFDDVSARDIQFVDKQYTRAKSFDTFAPCGPWLTTPDEIPNPCDLRLITRLNGKVRQDSSTKNLVLKVGRIIHALSKVMTLEPGDIIATGTPTGTLLSLSSRLKFLQHGDVVEVEIENLGKIRNTVVFTD